MALPALKEQQFANQLHPVQAQKRKQVRTGQVLQFPTGRPIGTDAAAVRENELSSGERFQAEQARRMADSSAQQDTLGLQLLVDQGVLSQAAFEQATAEAQQALKQLRAAATIQQALQARSNFNKVRDKIGGIELSEKQRKDFDEYREMLWREVRVGGPIVDDFAMGWTLGLGTLLSYVIWIWQALKGFKYRNNPEPLTVIALLSPPPMPLSVVGKGTLQMLKMIFTKLIDALGFLWDNVNLALVLVAIGIGVILIMLINCTVNPFTPSSFDGICGEFLKMVGAVAAE